MTPRLAIRWLGWTLLYTVVLWRLWVVAALLAPHAHTLTATLWVWVTAVLAPFGLAPVAAPAEEAAWWPVMPPLVIGLSFLALAAATWLNPSLAREAGAASVLSLFLTQTQGPRDWGFLLGARVERTGIVLLGLTMFFPLLAYGLAQRGLGMTQDMEESERSALRNFARWLLLGVPLATFGVASGDGMAALPGAIAIWVAGRHIGLHIALWRFVR